MSTTVYKETDQVPPAAGIEPGTPSTVVRCDHRMTNANIVRLATLHPFNTALILYAWQLSRSQNPQLTLKLWYFVSSFRPVQSLLLFITPPCPTVISELLMDYFHFKCVFQSLMVRSFVFRITGIPRNVMEWPFFWSLRVGTVVTFQYTLPVNETFKKSPINCNVMF